MRLAILSDIHGNLEAFQAVLADIERQKTDRIVCLGDMIGYGPDPEKVIRSVQSLQCEAVLGNHEAALISAKARSWMNFQARENSLQTEQMLSEESVSYCRSLPRFRDSGNAWFVHGFPLDSILAYLFNIPDKRIEKLFADSPASLFFVGHTHTLQIVTQQHGCIFRSPLAEGVIDLDKNRKYIINVGSVGQPRDGNNCAKYLIWDTAAWKLDVRFVPYDVEQTIRKIQALGFPEIYAERLR
jgi:predicted phosphodiesterase